MSRRAACILAIALTALGIVGWTLRRESKAPEQHFQDALAAFATDDVRTIEQALHALSRDPQYASHAALLDGLVLLRGRRPDAALEKLSRVGGDRELRDLARLHSAEALYKLGRLAPAESILQDLLAERPDDLAARRWLAAIYYDLGANDAALAEMQRVIELAPDDYRPHRLMGSLYHDFEQDAEAIASYRQALALSPPAAVHDEIVREFAAALIAQQLHQEALELLARTEPDAVSQVLEAQCLWTLGRRDEAEALLTQAREEDPDLRSLLLLEAEILQTDKDLAGALARLDRAVERDPHDAEARYRRARVLRQLGREREADAETEHWNRTRRLAERRTELSIQAVREPRNAEVREELADVLDQLGQTELADMWRQAAAACREAVEVRTRD